MEVKVLLDSINPYTGTRLTTLHCVYPQFIHQQVLTHRWFSIEPKDEKDSHYGGFSTNSSSLRAISFQRASAEFDVICPQWTLEQKGMQGEIVTNTLQREIANDIVTEMYHLVLGKCQELKELGIHHQDINNYLRPFQNIHTVITATDWDNFFNQRLHESTKPDMQRLAVMIKDALEISKPCYCVNHIPLVDDFDAELPLDHGFSFENVCFISAARLARISYFKWSDDPTKDLELAKKLIKDKHPSPFEHIAFAQNSNDYFANFKSWKQLRHQLF